MSAHGKTCLSADHPLPAKELLVVKALDEFAHATHSAVLVRGVTVTVTVTVLLRMHHGHGHASASVPI